MNLSAVARHYDSLTPEERFALILAAGARGDEAEQDRLVQGGAYITLTMPIHAPVARAFNELAWFMYVELLEEVARYDEAFLRADFAFQLFSAVEPEEQGADAQGDPGGEAEASTETGADSDESAAEQECLGEACMSLALAAGFALKTKAEGWKLFCTRRGIPPFALWKGLPGLDRLQKALDLAEKAALVPAGFLRWMNKRRPKEKPELTELPLTAESIADSTEVILQETVKRWSGK
jgi:hypothetical protein